MAQAGALIAAGKLRAWGLLNLAHAFALGHDAVASVLFGATAPAQIAENVAALALLDRLGEDELARRQAIGA